MLITWHAKITDRFTEFKNRMKVINKMMNIRYLTIIALMLFMLVPAQRSIGQAGSVISGGEILTDDYIVSFSAGQVFYTLIDREEKYITLGLQHPNINKLTNIPVDEETKPEISILPNPARDKIFIHFQKQDLSGYTIQLNSVNGHMVMKKIISGNEAEISLSGIYPGSYILLIYTEESFLGSFNIIKI